MRWLIVVLVSVLLLRLPSFFEPYYDGDEGVYYLLGQTIQRGAVLYRDIWDNKTPLLYFLYAINPTLLWAKLTATISVLGTCLGVYFLARKLKVNPFLPALLTGALLSFPALAGNTANAELYFTLPIVWGAYLVWERKWPVSIGLLLAIAFNLKVPALFDFLGIFLAAFILRREIKFYLPIAVVFIGVFLAFIGYFYYHQALSDFWTAAFTQNSTYVSLWSGPLGKLGNPLVARGLALLAALSFFFILYVKNKISKELLFLFYWLGFSIYAALLSGRPYPHYFLQIVPPATLFLLYTLAKYRIIFVISPVFAFLLVKSFGEIPSPVQKLGYYQNFLDYISERKSRDDYQLYFGQDNVWAYQMAAYIKQNTKPNEPIFIWGENDYPYILSGRPPAAKFIRAHHLTTVDPKNYDLTAARLAKFQPKYIFIARPVQFPFPQLEVFVAQNYRQVTTFGHFYVYKSNFVVTPPRWTPNY